MFDEGPRLDMVIRTQGTILGRTKVTSRAVDEDVEVAVDLQASHQSFAEHTVELSIKAPMSVSKPADLG